MDNNYLLNIQNDLLYKINNIHKEYIYIFLDYIKTKTRDEFIILEYNNQYYIIYCNSYKIVFNLEYNYWLLIQDNKTFCESKLIDDVINSYLFITNKLSICLHSQSMDPDTEVLNSILNKLKI
jgi:hypothetical protein